MHNNDFEHNDHDLIVGPQHANKEIDKNELAVLQSLILIASFFLVELLGGIISGSLALLADAGHMLIDSLGLLAAFIAFKLSKKSNCTNKTYGWGRVQVIAAYSNALLLFIIAFWIISEAFARVKSDHVIDIRTLAIVASLGLLVNLSVLFRLLRGDKENINLQGAILHVLADTLGSIFALLSAILIYFTGIYAIDAILSIILSILIFYTGSKLFIRSFNILMEAAPNNVNISNVAEDVKAVHNDIVDIHHIHFWTLIPNHNLASMHVTLKDTNNIEYIRREIIAMLEKKYEVEHPTIQIEIH